MIRVTKKLQEALNEWGVPYFIGLEYHTLILNRTCLVFMLQEKLVGLRVMGLLASSGHHVMEDLNNPLWYTNPRLYTVDEIGNFIQEGQPPSYNRRGMFVYQKEEIERVYFNPKRKWGMSHYPHNGRIQVTLRNGKSREWILVGDQDQRPLMKAFDELYSL